MHDPTIEELQMDYNLTQFIPFAAMFATVMLIWNTVEVGRNDAANIVNAVFGARVLKRKTAVRLAGIAVIVGACASSPVMETARKGIFDPAALDSLEKAISIYCAVYITNTVLLFMFSAYGMPVSTTACLVFALLGGGLAVGGPEVVDWSKSTQVISGIVCSIFISGIMAFLVQRAFRGAIGTQCEDSQRVRLHGPWISGLLLTGLVYFVLMKGMKNASFVKSIRAATLDEFGVIVLLVLWAIFTCFIWIVIRIGGDRITKGLFASMAILGMLVIALAFGQNDLANCASPGVASLMIWKDGALAASKSVPMFLLFGCGFLLVIGMGTKTAQRVTRAEVNTGSQGDVVRLYAPQWCVRIAKLIVPQPHPQEALAPEPEIIPNHKIQHYDALRAAVITSVSGSVIAFASGLGLPVSTTYVSFAAVVATGWADRIFLRGDSHLKLGRTIWVVFCWFASAFLAAIVSAIFSFIVSSLSQAGILLCLAINLVLFFVVKKRADLQDERLVAEATERKQHIMDTDENSQLKLFTEDSDTDYM